MRLSFPNGEHADVVIDGGTFTIGSADDNDVVLDAAGVAAHHARISIDEGRGVILRIDARPGSTHINARPVVRLGMLRLGDVLSVGERRMLLRPDADASVVQNVPRAPRRGEAPSAAASRVVLRGVSGPLFGCSFPIADSIEIGRAPEATVRLDDPALGERHARLENHGDFVVLRDLGSVDGSVVNGIPVRDAVLHPGDQIAFDHYRFVVEAPGLPPRGSAVNLSPGAGAGNTQTMQAVRASAAGMPNETGSRGSRGNIAWLIAAAVMIMLALAALLFYAPGLG